MDSTTKSFVCHRESKVTLLHSFEKAAVSWVDTTVTQLRHRVRQKLLLKEAKECLKFEVLETRHFLDLLDDQLLFLFELIIFGT